MRDKWFGDNRDIVKWAALAHIALEGHLKSILQVPYWRREDSRPWLSFEGKPLAIRDEVWKFFRNRNINSITGLKLDGVSIKVVEEEFNPDQRDAYLSKVKTDIQQTSRPLALFLDPDTGLEPERCCPKHTAIIEIKALWPVLKSGEWLVLYQHARRTHDDWCNSVANKISSLCSNMKAHVIRSEDIGKDVALICVEKA